MPEEAPLDFEINLIKKMMKELIERPGKKTSLTDRLHMLETVSKASTRLAGLMKTAQNLAQGKGDIQEILNTALDEVLKELREENKQK